MNNELTDSVIDAAAKELIVDAPDELLKGVLYLIEKDEKPKRRFAFGRFTAFGAVAAAILIFIGLQTQSGESTGGGLLDGSSNSAAPEAAVMNENETAISGRVMMDAVTAEDNDAASGEAAAPQEAETDAGTYAFAAPPELSPIEQAFYDWLDTFEGEVLKVEPNYLVIYDDRTELTTRVLMEDAEYIVTVTERDGQFEVSLEQD